MSINTVSVFRVEDVFGHGPYRDQDGERYELACRMVSRHMLTDAHPTIFEDDKLRRARINATNKGKFSLDGYVCGFSSLSQLSSWFAGFGEDLSEHEYVIAEYVTPADSVLDGDKQIMFDKSRAVLAWTTNNPHSYIE